MKKNVRNFVISFGLLAAFVIFTVLIMTVDVKAIGEGNTSVGFASLNGAIFSAIGTHLFWYNLTDWLGVVAILEAALFAVIGLVQLIKRRSLKKVDFEIIMLGALYIVVVLSYIFFEKFIVNYRPVIIKSGIEASYPSSHTMIVVCIMLSGLTEIKKLCGEKKILFNVFAAVSAAIVLVTVVGRFVSGVHWFTDIIGGLLLSSALLAFYYSIINCNKKKEI